MTQFKKMLIKKNSIMPLIEKLSQAYNNSDDDYIVINPNNQIILVLFDELEGSCDLEQ